ncbi:MAG TPA: type II secretion system minor pseudopilin GspK [Gammaproteobacteria bacterium]
MSRHERGVALITVLLVVALATTAAVAMVSRQQLDIRRTGNTLQYEQAYLYVNGIEQWASRVLRGDQRDNEYDHLAEEWATQLPPIPVEGGQLGGYLEDRQGRFNVNSLLLGGEPDPAAVERFRRLLLVLELDPDLVNALLDWLDADLEVRFPGGAEDGVYLAGEPAYRSANGSLASITELRLLHGLDQEGYDRLAPHVAALPEPAPINVNTATVPVLMSLAEGIDQGIAEMLVEARGEEGYAEMDDFLSQPGLEDMALPVEVLGVSSRYFVVTSQIQFGRISVGYQSMIERGQDNTSRVIRRAQGRL